MSKGKKKKKTRAFLQTMGKYLPSICRALGCRKTGNEESVKSYERRGGKGQEVQVSSVPTLTHRECGGITSSVRVAGTQGCPPDLRSAYLMYFDLSSCSNNTDL